MQLKTSILVFNKVTEATENLVESESVGKII